jgi:hypothetical protein
VDILARDYVRLLQGMLALHGELLTAMREKLEAMKQADSERVASLTARETQLAERAAERDGLRRQLTRSLVDALGLEASDPAAMRISELAEYFAEPLRSQALAAALGLRQISQDMELASVTTRLVTEHMLRHLGDVLAVMRGGGWAMEQYSRTGQVTGGQAAGITAASVFEAVG